MLNRIPARRVLSVTLTCTLIWLTVATTGCSSDDKDYTPSVPTDDGPTPVIYEDEPVVTTTDDEGRVAIQSSTAAVDTVLGIDLRILDEGGDPVSGVDVHYDEESGRVLLVADGRDTGTTSVFVYATVQELVVLASDVESASVVPGLVSSEMVVSKRAGIITLTIFLVLAVTALAAAEVGILRNVYRMQTFYLTDFVDQTEDYVHYCKSWEEIAELIDAKVSTVIGAANMVLVFVGAGQAAGSGFGSDSALEIAMELAAEATQNGAEDYRDMMLNEAIRTWGTTMDEIEGEKVGVRVYFEGSGPLRRIDNLYAVMEVVRDDPLCEISGSSVFGVVTDAQTLDPIENVLVRLTSGSSRVTFTDRSGEYSFTSLQSGTYELEFEKEGYVDEARSVTLDGSPVGVNVVMSTIVDGFRIVLTWGASPLDLDTHWFSGLGHVYYGSRGSLTSPPHAELDRDDTDGFGPETLTLDQRAGAGDYAVHQWSSSGSVASSGARVVVYRDDAIVQTVDVPTSGSGRWWDVLSIDDEGNVTIVNEIVFSLGRDAVLELHGTKEESGKPAPSGARF